MFTIYSLFLLLLNFNYFFSFPSVIFSITYPFLLFFKYIVAVSSIFYNFLFPSHLFYLSHFLPPNLFSHAIPPRHRRFFFSLLRLFLHHFHPPQFPLHCLFFNTHTHTITLYSLPNSQSLLPTCSKISPQACAFAYSSIQLFTRTSPSSSLCFPPSSTDEHTPLLPLRCIDSRLCTLSLATATRDINSRPSR